MFDTMSFNNAIASAFMTVCPNHFEGRVIE